MTNVSLNYWLTRWYHRQLMYSSLDPRCGWNIFEVNTNRKSVIGITIWIYIKIFLRFSVRKWQWTRNYDHNEWILWMVFFPMNHDDNDNEDMLACNICGMFRMDDSIPMITCDNSKCDLVFHVGCLKQWWAMFSDSKTFLHIELGTKCPMCKEVCSIRILYSIWIIAKLCPFVEVITIVWGAAD